MSIHQNIKTRRELKQWSQARLAEEVSRLESRSKPLSWQTVQQWEREQGTQPSSKRLQFVAKALDCSASELVGETAPVAREPDTANAAYANAALIAILGNVLSAHTKTRRGTLANLLFRFAQDPENKSLAEELSSLINLIPN